VLLKKGNSYAASSIHIPSPKEERPLLLKQKICSWNSTNPSTRKEDNKMPLFQMEEGQIDTPINRLYLGVGPFSHIHFLFLLSVSYKKAAVTPPTILCSHKIYLSWHFI